MSSKTLVLAAGPAKIRMARAAVLGTRRSSPQVWRKFYHLINGLACAGLYAFVLTREQALVLLLTLGGAFLALDAARFFSPRLHSTGLLLFGKLMRREELHSLTANSFYILGLLLVTWLFPKPVVVLSVLFLAVGDPAAALVGTSWGKHRLWKNKSLEGAAANFAASALVTGLVYSISLGRLSPAVLLMATVGGLVSMIAELCPLPIDDNFTIPVLSALMLSPLVTYFPFF
jgi:dolichol kinase